jgi:hypothetical protein
MATYTHAPQPVHDLVFSLVEKHHPDLAEHEVTFCILMAFAPVDDNGKRKGTALTHGGYPADGLAKINNLKDRVAGLSDCTIFLDGDHWEEKSEDEQTALLDHELTHFIPTGEDDDAGRPKLKIRKHDIQLGGFHEIIDRYGKDAGEAKLLQLAGLRQGFLFDLEATAAAS